MDYFKVFVIINKKVFKEYIENKYSYDTTFLSDENNNSKIHLVPYTIPYELIKMYVDEKMEQEYVTYINSVGKWEELTYTIFDENDIKTLIDMKAIISYEEYQAINKEVKL